MYGNVDRCWNELSKCNFCRIVSLKWHSLHKLHQTLIPGRDMMCTLLTFHLFSMRSRHRAGGFASSHARSICALAMPSTFSLFSSAAPDVGSVQKHRIVARKRR
jgi:hypothetical protein